MDLMVSTLHIHSGQPVICLRVAESVYNVPPIFAPGHAMMLSLFSANFPMP
jgi:hypothetical protein